MKIFSKNLVGYVHYRRREVIASILESSEAEKNLAEAAQKKNQSVEDTRNKSREILLEMISAYKAKALKVCYWIVRILKRFMFQEINLYGDEIKEIYQLTKEGNILFYLPNHKSHMDYLLISYNLFNGEVAPPHIAAGVNLSFFPVGPLFRKTGAYFIRRKISGNVLYTQLLKNYFDWMLSKNISQEFYMEGGRSRDGKIREAQSGILTLFIEQILARNLQNRVYLVPTSITYDRLPEMKGMLNELKGSEKEKESILTIIRSWSMLWRYHGQVHLQFGKPVALTSLIQEDFSKKEFKKLAKQVFTEVQKQKTITVSSLVALSILTFKNTVTKKEVFDHIEWMMKFLKPCCQYISEEVANAQQQWPKLIERFEKFGWYEIHGDQIRIHANKRLEMNYYKNDLLPVFMPFFQTHSENIRSILLHEYPYAQHVGIKSKSESKINFLDQMIQPIVSLHAEIKKYIDQNTEINLLNKDVQKSIFKTLKDSNFEYPEMLTTEAIKSACQYFHRQNKN